MTTLLEFRERIRRFYSKNGRFVVVAAKFLLMFLSLFIVTATLDYKGIFSSPVIMLLLAAMVCILPHSCTLAILLIYIGAELYVTGLEALIIYVAMIMIFIAVYFIFKPGKSYCVTISILLGLAQFYGPLPMIVGLMFTPISCIGMGIGIIISAFVTCVASNATILSQASSLTMTKKMLQIITAVFLDENLWIELFLAIGVAILVYIIRRMSVKHSWTIAIIVGCISSLLLSIIISLVMDITENYLILIINFLLEVVTGVVLMFLFFMVDYSREEILQFEDEEYYYYVKAVPKLTMAIQNMKVTRIREHNIKNITRTSENVTFIKNKDVTERDEKEQNSFGVETPVMEEKSAEDTTHENKDEIMEDTEDV